RSEVSEAIWSTCGGLRLPKGAEHRRDILASRNVPPAFGAFLPKGAEHRRDIPGCELCRRENGESEADNAATTKAFRAGLAVDQTVVPMGRSVARDTPGQGHLADRVIDIVPEGGRSAR